MGQHIKALGIPVTTLGIRRGDSLFSGLTKFRQAIRGFRPDVIQGWMYHGNLATILACVLAPGCPATAWNVRHSLYDLDYERLMTRQVIRANRIFSSSPDVILYNSRLSRKQHETFGFTALNGQIIPNGIDMHRFCFSHDARIQIRSELGVPADAQIVGHVARLHPMKDHAIFVRAAVDIAFRYPAVHFLLSGRDVFLKNKTFEPLIPVHVRNRFHLLGDRSDVSDLMCAMDIFCQSSWSEAFPNVLGEAMASGVPCVATDVGDSTMIVGDTGIIVPPRDKEALRAGIEKLLMMPLNERYALCVNARTRIEVNYTLGSIVDQYAALYETLMMEKGGC